MGICFEEEKSKRLSDVDNSRKGSVDENIKEVVSYINQESNYYTTSSCAGRIVIFSNIEETKLVFKKGCNWLLVSHSAVTSEQVLDALNNHDGSAVFKFEPFILHVRCFQLSDAQKLHAISISSGFRNSGITVSNAGRITLAIRSTHSLEVPLSEKGSLLVSPEYIDYIVKKANIKMAENQSRIDRLYSGFQCAVNKLLLSKETKEKHKELKQQLRGKMDNSPPTIFSETEK